MKTQNPLFPILGRAEPFEIDPRYFLQTAERAMQGDIVRALVELITNSDESYARLEDDGKQVGGEIRIFIERRRRGKPSRVEVLDFAEGMYLEEMVSKLRRVGGKTSGFMEKRGQRRRGLMGRGSKECVVFGDLQFRSIKEGKYSEIHLKQPASFVPIANREATAIDRAELEISRGNGTRVTVEVQPKHPIPTHEMLLRDLPRYYSLRDIASSSRRKLLLIDLGKRKGEKSPLQYVPKEGGIVLDEVFTISGYPKAEAHLVLKKAQAPIKTEPESPYWEGGVLIRSNYAIHGLTSFSRDIGNNPHLEHFFGSLDCKYIDDLQVAYEEEAEEGRRHTSENPVRVIDPERFGLAKGHPFTETLYRECAQKLKELLKREEEAVKHQQKNIENKRTTERLKKLAGEVSRFIKDRTETIESLDDELYLDSSEVPSGGMKIVPGGARVVLFADKKFYVYVRPATQQGERHVSLSTGSAALQLSTSKLSLMERGDGILTNSFSVKGIEENDRAHVRVLWGPVEKLLQIQVVRPENAAPVIPDFSFEKSVYSVREGKKKDIRIVAKWPEFVHGEVPVNLTASNDSAFEILTKIVRLKYEQLEGGIKAAVGTARILGKKRDIPATLRTTLQGREISVKIRVIPDKPIGKDFEIKVVDEDLGNQRAIWDGNLLKISGRHDSVKRYLGSPENGFPGQERLHFRLLIAELIADNVARRILELNAQKDVGAFENMDVTGFYKKHREHMNDFLGIAHRIQIPNSELDG